MSHCRDSSDDDDDTFVTVGTPLPTYSAGQLTEFSWRAMGVLATCLGRLATWFDPVI